MSDLRIFAISGSALSAQSVRLNTIASNMANAGVAGSSPEESYRARYPVFRTVSDPDLGGARTVDVAAVIESNQPGEKRYAPDHPLADEQGYIYMPNVNLVEQMADMIAASRSYQSNLEVMSTARELMIQTLQLGR